MHNKEEVGAAIRRARERLGITQQELAEQAGFPNLQTISDVERGVRDLKARELHRLAKSLLTTYDVLLGARNEPNSRVFWRRGTTALDRAQEVRFVERVSRYAMVEDWCDLPAPEPLPDFGFAPATADYGDVEALANRVARILDLGSRPAAALLKVLEERFRVKVFYEDLPGAESAACIRDEFGAAVLMNVNQAPWRRNYNFAHEVFHLVTWTAVEREWPADAEEPVWAEKLERFANSFASHLLLPADEVSEQYRARCRGEQVADVDLIELAREFDVSTEALVWRLRHLRLLTQQEAEDTLARSSFRRLDKATMVNRWYQPSTGLPDRFVRLAYLAHAKGRMSISRLAEFLETSVSAIRALEFERERAEEATAAA